MFMSLPKLVLHTIFYQVRLEDVSKVATVCKKFSTIFAEEGFWRNYLPTLHPDRASHQFLKKFGSRLSIPQLASCQMKCTPLEVREVIKAWMEEKGVVKLGEKRVLQSTFLRLIYAIRTFEREILKRSVEGKIEGEQNAYAHMYLAWSHVGTNFEQLIHKHHVLTYEEKNSEWVSGKKDYVAKLDKYLTESANLEGAIALLLESDRYLQIESSASLTHFYTEVWKPYSPTSLIPHEEIYQLLPSENFQGFCNTCQSKAVTQMQSIEKLFFTNEHLECFNKTFSVVNSLDIILAIDIDKSALESFIQKIKNAENFPSVQVGFTSPIYPEVRFLFTSFQWQAYENIKVWLLVD